MTRYLAAATLLAVAGVIALYVLSVDGAETKYSALGWGGFAAWCAYLAFEILP